MKMSLLQNHNNHRITEYRSSQALSDGGAGDGMGKSPASCFWLLLHGLCYLIRLILGFRFSRLVFFLLFSTTTLYTSAPFSVPPPPPPAPRLSPSPSPTPCHRPRWWSSRSPTAPGVGWSSAAMGSASDPSLAAENLRDFARGLGLRLTIDFVRVGGLGTLALSGIRLAPGEPVTMVLTPAIFHLLGPSLESSAALLHFVRRASLQVVLFVDNEWSCFVDRD